MAGLAHPLAGGIGGDGAAAGDDIARRARIDLWGEEILWSAATGDLELAPDGDYMLVTGSPSIRQAIRNRLITRPGELPWAPDYGCGVLDYLGSINSDSRRAELRGRVRDQLLQDPRLDSVEVADVREQTVNSVPVLVVGVRGIAAGLALPAAPFILGGG